MTIKLQIHLLMSENVFQRAKRLNLPYNTLELGYSKNVKDCNQRNFCNESIYMILKESYLKRIIEEKHLWFSLIIKAWEDPYELFLLKQKIDIEGHSLNNFFKNDIYRHYGQSWSTIKDSDALWRIYSTNKKGVQIKTSVIKMINILNQTRESMYMVPLFGKVKYLKQEEISEWMKNELRNGSGYLWPALSDSLFIKRKEFEHEKEVRFIIRTHEKSANTERINIEYDHIDIMVDNPFNFIEEIVLDPRLSEEEFLKRKEELSSFTNEIPIVKSNLYAFTPLKFSIPETPLKLNI